MEYFAYGSNLCVPRLEKRDADPTNPRTATLAGFELLFNKKSPGNSKANIRENSNSIVYGVIFTISDNRREGLRSAEGWPDNYQEETLHVVTVDDNQPVEVTAYIARDSKRLTDNLPPYDWYVEHILKGGRLFGFPETYLETIESFRTLTDPDKATSTFERSYWTQN